MPQFAHHKLEAYHACRELAIACVRLARSIPRGHRKFADQLIRSGCTTPILTAEGANRWSPGVKRQRYEEALGETGEAAAIAEIVEDAGLVTGAAPADVLRKADRAAALLTGLVKSFSHG